MGLMDRFDTPSFGADVADILATFWSDTGANGAYDRAVQLWGTPQIYVVQSPLPDRVGFLLLEYPQRVITIFAGASQRSHMSGYVNYMGTTLLSGVSAPINRWCIAVSEFANTRMAGSGFTQTKEQINCGHSLGGVVAMGLSLGQRAQVGMWGPVSCLTFGSPKPGSQAAAAAAVGMPLQRWMNDGDPVPRVWPDRGESIALALVTDIPTASAGYGLAQWHGGTVISPDLTLTAATYPALGQNNIDGSLVAWWWRISGTVQHPHHALAYYDRLRRLAFANPQPQAPPPPRTNVAENRPPRQTLNELRALNQADLGEFVDAPDAETAHGFVPTFKFFRYAKENGVYNVYFMDDLVATFKKRGRPRKMCSGGNKMIQNYLRAPIGDSDQFKFAVDDFLFTMDLGQLT